LDTNKHTNELAAPENFSRDVILMLALAGLGFMVDVYDMALFGVVRVQSLNSLGVSGAEALSAGVLLLNWQMAGMAVGGMLWGVLGDKRGRRSILLGAIVLYSIANVANAFVSSIETYAAARFFVGIGLAGEVGAAMTIAAEVTPKSVRAYGTAGVAAFSTVGAILASVLGHLMPWRMAYLTAGAAGLALLLARFSLKETVFFQNMQKQSIERGSFRLLLSNRYRILKLIRCVLAAAPLWFALAVIVSFAPEISGNASITVAACIPFSAIGESIGEFLSGIVSQFLQSRRLTMFVFLAAGSAFVLPIVHCPASFYAPLCLPLLLFLGYWSVAITTTAEQFGTNLRATATSLVPNFVRASAIPVTCLFTALSSRFGPQNAASVVGVISCVAAAISIYFMEETAGKDLDFIER
jgi:putative MFS transporter